MIKRVHIRGYKSLEDLEVELTPLSVLLGPNAAGKSNFLDALQVLSRIAMSRTLKEAFEPPYRGHPIESFSFGEGGIEDMMLKGRASFSIEVDVELSPVVKDAVNAQIREVRGAKTYERGGRASPEQRSLVKETHLRYRIEVQIVPRTGLLSVRDEYLAALRASGEPTRRRKPFLEGEKEHLVLRMEGQAHPSYHERNLDHSMLSRPLYPPHYPHIVAMREELKRWLFFYLEPRERMRAPNPVKEVRHIGLMGEELAAFLNTLKALDEPQFQAVEKALRMVIPSITGIDVSVNKLGEVELFLQEGRRRIPARIVSEGTLRLLGLLALSGVKDPPSLIGFEEPENGIHPGRLRPIAELLKTQASGGETQLIVTTHSPYLPDYIPPESLYVCRREGKGTLIAPFQDVLPLERAGVLRDALEGDGSEVRVSDLIVRGDLDA